MKQVSCIFVLAWLAAGCDPYIANCVEELEKTLKAPSTLNVVKTRHVRQKEAFTVDQELAAKAAGKVYMKPTRRHDPVYAHKVIVTYDAENSYSALIRGELTCEYSEFWEPSFGPRRMTDQDGRRQ